MQDSAAGTGKESAERAEGDGAGAQARPCAASAAEARIWTASSTAKAFSLQSLQVFSEPSRICCSTPCRDFDWILDFESTQAEGERVDGSKRNQKDSAESEA